MVHASTGKPQSMASWVWGISDLLRGTYKPHQYGNVILPFTILRRMDCVLAPPTGAVRSADEQNYWNTSGLNFNLIVASGTDLLANLHKFIDGFNGDAADVFEKFHLATEIEKMDSAGVLGPVVQKFAELDLHPDEVSNTDMGVLFEELIRRSHHDSPGEDFTPRDAVALLVDLLISERREHIENTPVSQTIYDPTAGTGGLLTVTSDRFFDLNEKASLRLYGQEINDQSYAVCKADVMSKGKAFGDVALGNTLTDDQFPERTGNRGFHYVVSNPPYGVDWKPHKAEVTTEHAKGPQGRFPAGLPRVSDGQMLFLQHVVAKMKTPTLPVTDPNYWLDGGRGAIVMSGSPLFNGAAGSGESEIRRYLLENDLVEAIVALPAGLFTNTGIGTYIWVLDNAKRPERQGKVQLIDARDIYSKMRKNVGDKNREMNPADRQRVLDAYEAFDSADTDISKVFTNDDFGYWTITVERPLLDDDGQPVTDRKGTVKPDPKQRDTENVPFGYGDQTDPDACIKAYMETEVLPYYSDAWVDEAKTKVGYEIPFTRHFYKYVPPRPLAEIDADLNTLAADIMAALRKVEAA